MAKPARVEHAGRDSARGPLTAAPGGTASIAHRVGFQCSAKVLNMVVSGLTGLTNQFDNMTTTGSTEEGYQKRENMAASFGWSAAKIAHLDVDAS